MLLILILLTSFYTEATCTKISGSGVCNPDGSNGCHVEQGTVCEETATPEGCQRISCNGSCPTRGYYAPYGNTAAWNAFKANLPATMTVTACCTTQDYYRDADGDGFGSSTLVFSSCTGTSGYVTNSTDCCDSDSNAYPGQTSAFTSPRNTCGGYDYNCDSTETMTNTSFTRRGSTLGSQASWTGWQSTSNCTGGMTGNFGANWAHNIQTSGSALACGNTYPSCSGGGLVITGGSMRFSGTCYPDNSSLYCWSSTAAPTRTISCR